MQFPNKNLKSSDSKASSSNITPSMSQYLEIKKANPNSLLWYRMGDFYELFFADAEIASKALSIVLTKRGKHMGESIPMCGVPVARADEYLQRLIRQGYRVAVCEQLEQPQEARKRGSKAVVHRDVVRLVTPGTLTEDTLLDSKARNFLTSVFEIAGDPIRFALASLDISTGEFEVGIVGEADLNSELVRLLPGEILAVDTLVVRPDVIRTTEIISAALTPIAQATFDGVAGQRALKNYLGVSDLGGFGEFTRGELAAIGALLKYVELTQIGKRPVIRPPKRAGHDKTMIIDAASRSSLELIRNSGGDKQGTLLTAIDRTLTGPGTRELTARISTPLRDITAINKRQDAISLMVNHSKLRDNLRFELRNTPDVARAVSRLSLQRGGPRDLADVRDALNVATKCALVIEEASSSMGLPDLILTIVTDLRKPSSKLLQTLTEALVDAPPALKRDGGFIREEYNASLAEARSIKSDSRQFLILLETKYAEITGVKSLKIRHNNILGYFIEVTATGAKQLMQKPLCNLFTHRQTMANGVRFTTAELSKIEGKIASATERALALEHEIFTELTKMISAEENALSYLATALADLDCTLALAQLASEEEYVRPIVDDTFTLDIRGGRHPVVEQALRRDLLGQFIENDCCLTIAANSDKPSDFSEAEIGRIWLVTGPNMAGKSTFLRQNALIVLLAQIGSFVPAKSAHIGIVDRLFSRVGASDDIASGRSTFMVEMVETAAILNQATNHSFVILDEIGRGTSTFDGLSIAWATIEYLHDKNSCRTLFATHYHELTLLADKLAEVANVTVSVREWQDEIIFLHEIKPGTADRSYGIHVARLAGLPKPVTTRADEVLAMLEKDQISNDKISSLKDLPLFAADNEKPKKQSILLKTIRDINPNELTPRSALELIYSLKESELQERE
ncbi:MAG: DNA mismatch repair protein MutS [Hyphomicrobiaceae bacterium]|nr:DNA mismatch repair protein MutS [Hyphomicrobiaceae bacterium]